MFDNKKDIKEISVYCLGCQYNKSVVPLKNVISLIQREVLKGQKTPHQVSLPVLREQDGIFYMAFFVFFYTADQVRSAMVLRPLMWILANIKTGTIISKNLCSDHEFSDATYEKLYDIKSAGLQKYTKYHQRALYTLLDVIRVEYKKSGILRLDMYTKYIQHILEFTPKEYRKFYTDLNNVK